jgi:hypothetical protein
LQLIRSVILAVLSHSKDEVGHVDIVRWRELGLVEFAIDGRDINWDRDILTLLGLYKGSKRYDGCKSSEGLHRELGFEANGTG